MYIREIVNLTNQNAVIPTIVDWSFFFIAVFGLSAQNYPGGYILVDFGDMRDTNLFDP
jgi:hypothetical protein